MSSLNSIQESKLSMYARKYEEYNKSLECLIDKTTDFLAEKGSEWVRARLKGLQGYDRSIETSSCFMPFISKNLNCLILDIKKEMPLSPQEENLISDAIFIEQLCVSIFAETCLGNMWFFDFRGD